MAASGPTICTPSENARIAEKGAGLHLTVAADVASTLRGCPVDVCLYPPRRRALPGEALTWVSPDFLLPVRAVRGVQ